MPAALAGFLCARSVLSPVVTQIRPLRAFNVYGYIYTIKPSKRDTGRFRPLHVDSMRTGYNDAPRATVSKARKRATTGATLDGCISVSRPAGMPPRANVGDPGRDPGRRVTGSGERQRATRSPVKGSRVARKSRQSRQSRKSKVGKVESRESRKSLFCESRESRESRQSRESPESRKSAELGELIKSRCQSRESRESGESESRSSTSL